MDSVAIRLHSGPMRIRITDSDGASVSPPRPSKAKRIRMTPPQESRAIDVDDELASLAIVPRTVSPHLDALGEKAKDYARNARAENTRRAYESDWRQFSSWLRRQGFPAPAPGSTDRRALSRRLRRWNGPDHGDERRLAGAAAVGDRLALSTIRPAARHPGSPYRHRAGRHSPRPWPPARAKGGDLRRRSSGHAGHVGQ